MLSFPPYFFKILKVQTMQRIHDDYEFVRGTIKSCENLSHLEISVNLIDILKAKYSYTGEVVILGDALIHYSQLKEKQLTANP